MSDASPDERGEVNDPGFPATWHDLYRRDRKNLCRLALALAPHIDWESAVEDTFVKALEEWDTIKNPPMWLRTVLVNLIRDECRKPNEPTHLTDDHLALLKGSYRFMLCGLPSDADDTLEVRETLEAIDRLEGKRRLALALRISGSSDDEIAQIMKCAKRTVQNYISRALKEITETVGNPHRRSRSRSTRGDRGPGGE